MPDDRWPAFRSVRFAGALLLAGCAGASVGQGLAPEAGPPPFSIPALPLPGVEADEYEGVRDAAPPLLPLELANDAESVGTRDGGSGGDAPVGPGSEPRPLHPERIRALLDQLPAPGPAAAADEGSASAPLEGGARATAGRDPGGDGAHAAADPLVRTVVPAGPTDLAPHVTIVFAEPMVPPGEAAAPAETAPPARLDPSPPGSWRWLDARTLRFQPEAGRLPGATSFTVTVPSGTRTLAGHTLGEKVETSFRTAGPRAVGGRPADEPSELRPVILLTFDQRIDPDEVLAAAQIHSATGLHNLTLAPPAALTSHPRYAAAAEEAGDGQWVALQPVEALPAGAELRLVLAPGLRSEEGPLPQDRAQELRFRTRDVLRIAEVSCGGEEEPCEAFRDWSIRFTNPLDVADSEGTGPGESVGVEPAVPGLRAFAVEDELRLQGLFEPFTTYRIVLPAGLSDVFGQSLGENGGDNETLEIRFGAAGPFLRLPGAPFVALDPAGARHVEVSSRGTAELEVELFRVGVEEWPAFAALTALYGGVLPRDRIPGERVLHQAIAPGSGSDAEEGWYARTPVDLGPALLDGFGHAILIVRATAADGQPIGEEAAWIQLSGIGLTAVSDHAALVAQAWAAGDGAPLEGIRVELSGSGAMATTDGEGLARLPLGAGDSLLIARRGADSALLLPGPRPGLWTGWARDERLPRPLWYAITDRELYRPGEEVWVHGWMRTPSTRNGESALRAPGGVDSLLVSLRSSRGETFGETSTDLLPDGRFHLRLPLPDNARTGRTTVDLVPVEAGEAENLRGVSTPMEIAEFRRPEYEVLLEAEPGPHLAHGSFAARVEARYFDGPGLAGAPADWHIRTSLAMWRPPGWDGWHVGPGPHTRREGARDGGEARFGGLTDADGAHGLRVRAGEPRRPFPVQLQLEAEVRDLDRQVGVASTSRVVHPAGVVAALRPARRWLALGEDVEVLVAVADLDGRVIETTPPEVRMERLESESDPIAPLACERVRHRMDGHGLNGRAEVEVASCTFRPVDPGHHRLVAEVVDGGGALSRSEVEVRVTGPRIGLLPRSPFFVQEVLDVTPDRERYAPGDTAQVLVESSIPEGRGLAVVQRFGIRRTVPFELRDGAALVPIPLQPDDAGSVRLTVEVSAGSGAPAVQRRVQYLEVSAEGHRLSVEVRAEPSTVEPGDSLTVHVRARDGSGHPAAGGTVTLWAVDEAVLGLADYTVPDPIQRFHGCCGGSPVRWVSTHNHLVRSRGPVRGAITARLLDARSGVVFGQAVVRIPELELQATSGSDGEVRLEGVPPGMYTVEIFHRGGRMFERRVQVGEEGLDLGVLLLAPLGASGEVHLDSLSIAAALGMESRQASMRSLGYAMLPPPTDAPELRRDFTPLAAFVPGLTLDGEGSAEARIRLPDTMTRYRIFALVSRDEQQFGQGEGAVTARRDVVVRATPPRFLHPGDHAEVPVTVQNASEGEFEVEVVARARALANNASFGWRIPLRAGERRELRVPVEANGIGEAAVEVLAVTTSQNGEAAADALGVAVSVRPPEGSLRVGAMHGRLVDADELSLPIDLPASALDGRGEIVVTASTSLLHGIAEAVRMLGREPVPWPEVAAPRLLALAGGIGVVEALRPAGVPPPDDLRDRMAADVDILLEAFRSGRTLDAFTSIQATHALLLAQSAGAEVPAFDLHRIGRDLGEGISELGDELPHPGAPEAARLAYALHVASGLDLPGDVAREVALRWTRSFAPEDLPGEALAWLLRPLAGEEAEGEILRILDNRALRSTSGATLRQGEVTGAVWMASHRTTDAIVLAALLESGDHDDPRARDLVVALTRSLLAHRDGTTWWASAFESAWGVLALGLAFEREQAAVPADLVVTGHLGDEQVGHTRLGGEDASALEWRVPVDRPGELRIHTEGNGTLHLRVELRYTDPAQDAAPVDRGFSLVRSYEAVDEPDDVVREEDGSWRIRAGARVRVRLTLTTPVRRHLVELRDPLAGGFEAIDRRQGQGQARDPTGTLTARMPAPDPAETRGRLPWLIAPTTDWTELAFRARIQAGLPWHTHREVADGRVDAYAAFLPAGSFETTYLVRAAVPGSYHIAAPRVEEVSHPETSGAGMADRVLIEVRDGG